MCFPVHDTGDNVVGHPGHRRAEEEGIRQVGRQVGPLLPGTEVWCADARARRAAGENPGAPAAA
eukprot:CAMPEP_0117692060 /NCGR_PEP_ID=MMETSP0804-20121206/26101_1 /TAXON_ID=1074897 /ORGANISM="Tetraselmis astigmatica, Strain CCMP880" /LENGTH=63 /DNA_ID=CAMNT_0005505433 /DNA_START=1048 /DNA_END=1239 /DNA_ORIENTATION=-